MFHGKKIRLLILLAVILTGQMHAAASATVSQNPEWWTEDKDSTPRFINYAIFTLTEREDDQFSIPSDEACSKAALGNTGLILDCDDHEFVRIDKRMNRAYRNLSAALPSAKRMQLRSEQRQWLAKRDAVCDTNLTDERASGGTIYLLDMSRCRIGELRRRTVWIELYHGYAQRRIR
jgi:uncharacterized protein YecT (DUF1311 family)